MGSLFLENNSIWTEYNFIGNIFNPILSFPAQNERVEEFLKIPHDAYTVQTIVAKKGDNITIKFYNLFAKGTL